MELSLPQSYILYLLGLVFDEFDKQHSGKLLQLALTKSDFIKIAKRAQAVTKQERAMYKNLEWLENEKYVSYDNEVLHLTAKGEKEFQSMVKQVSPYVRLTLTISSENLLAYAKKAQTQFTAQKL